MNGSALASALPWAVAAVAGVLLATFVAAKVSGKHRFIDTAWGLLFAAVAIVVFLRGTADGPRRWLLLLLPLAWGLRLAIHIGRRNRGKPEDPRYEQLLGKARGNPDLYALRMVYLLQGVLALVIASPIVAGGFAGARAGLLTWVGVAVWAVGVAFEAVGDAQLERFRRDPANRGRIMDVGLWRFTRHPNYFGDACVWWGIFLVAAEAPIALITVYAPVVMTLLLTKGSGARILERHMSGRPGWDAYTARTSGFIPWPPRRGPVQLGPSSRRNARR
jgi:steroid 5-alpha reductase family enzyme